MDKCSVRVRVGGGYSSHSGSPCHNPAKVIRDGKPYCGTHDPEAIKARREERNIEADAKWAREREAQRRQAVIQNLAYGISTRVFDQKAKEIKEFYETLENQIK